MCSPVMSWDQKLTQLFFSSLNQDMFVLQVQGAGMVTGQASPYSKFTSPEVKGLKVIPTPYPSGMRRPLLLKGRRVKGHPKFLKCRTGPG